MVDIIIIDEMMRCVSMTIWKMLPIEGSIKKPEIPIEPQEQGKKEFISLEQQKKGYKDNTRFYHIDRVKNLILKESKGLSDNERVVAVRSGTVHIGKIISNEDIIII